MRRLLTTLAGVALVVGLAAPAWADNAQKPADRSIMAYGHNGYHGGGRDYDRNRRGYDRAGYGRSRHDDEDGSYRDRYYYDDYNRYDDGCGDYGCNDPYGYGYYDASAPSAESTSAAPGRDPGGYADARSQDRPKRFRSPQDDPPGEGRSHYDKRQHDDPSILF